MEDQRLAEKMYRRTRDAPMSCRNSIDLLFVMQRHAVFTLNQDSADHISNIIFAQQFLEDAEPGKKYELIDDYSHRRYGAQPASKLREAMEQAGVKWAEILRDEDLVDVRIIVFPSEERDFEHVYPPVDLLVSYFHIMAKTVSSVANRRAGTSLREPGELCYNRMCSMFVRLTQ